MAVPLVLCLPRASETPGDTCQQQGTADPSLTEPSSSAKAQEIPDISGAWPCPCPCPSCHILPAAPRTPGRLSDSPIHAGLCPVNICACSFRNVFHAPIV